MSHTRSSQIVKPAQPSTSESSSRRRDRASFERTKTPRPRRPPSSRLQRRSQRLRAVGAPPAPLIPGDVVDRRYRVLEQLGQGGMGRVYRVSDELGGRTLALKTLRPDLHEPSYLDFFSHEFAALAELRHPNLAEVYDFGCCDERGELYFTMEYILGHNLFHATEGAGERLLIDYLVQVCRALDYIHSRGLIHHDIKPENVLVSGGRIRLVDFGLSLEEELASHVEEVRGTLSYLAPEVVAGYPYDRRCDFYSLGIVLYRLLRRRLPREEMPSFPAGWSKLSAPLPDVEREDIDPRWRVVLRGLAHADPDERFGSGNDVIACLNAQFGTEHALETKETGASYVLSGRQVGRSRERERFLGLVESLADGELDTGLLVVSGPAGIGKQRFLRSCRIAAQLAGVDVVGARCYESDRSPFGPARELLRAMVGLVGPGAPEVLAHEDALAEIGALDGLEGVADYPQSLPPAHARGELHQRLCRFVMEVASCRPLLLGLADMHWADSETAALVASLARAASVAALEGRGSLLVLASCDPETSDGAAPLLAYRQQRWSARWELGPLSSGQVGRLIRSMLGGGGLSDRVVRRIADETDGNPYFVEALLQSLVESGALHRGADGRWALVGEADALRIPGSCQQLVQERMERLPLDARRALELLAILERPASLALLLELAESGASGATAAGLRRGLRELDRRQLLRRRSGGGGQASRGLRRPGLDTCALAYRLRHNALRRLVYGGIEPERRRELHRRAAAALERVPGEEAVDQLAHHYREAGELQPALHYTLLAARRSARLGAVDQAAEGAQVALGLLPAGDRRRLPALLLVADVAQLQGRQLEAEAACREALSVSADPAVRADVGRRLAELAARQGDHKRAIARYRELLADLDPSAEPLRARLLVGLGRALELIGDLDGAAAQASAALTCAPLPQVAIGARQLLGNIAWSEGDYGAAISHHEAALAAQSPEDSKGYAACLNNLALVRQDLGDAAQARSLYERSLIHWRRHGDPAGVALCQANLGVLLREQGALEQALARQDEALAAYRRIGDLGGEARTLVGRGETLAALGRWTESVGDQRACLAICEESGEAASAICAHLNLGWTCLTFGDLMGAEGHAGEALALADGAGARVLVAAGWLLEANLLSRRGLPARALGRAAAARGAFAELGCKAELARALQVEAGLLAEQGAHEAALTVSARGLLLARELAQPALIAGALLALGRLQRQAGQLVSAAASLDEASALASALGHPELRWRALHEQGRCMAAQAAEPDADAVRARRAARRRLLEAVAIGRQIWEALPEQLATHFLDDPRHLALSADVAALAEDSSHGEPS